MSWFRKLMPSKIRTAGGSKRTVPEGLWVKCDSCSAVLYRSELERNFDVCPKCSHHMRIGARRRLELFLDEGSGHELGERLEPVDALAQAREGAHDPGAEAHVPRRRGADDARVVQGLDDQVAIAGVRGGEGL